MDQNTKCPKVHSAIVTFVENDFGGYVLWCTAKSPSLTAIPDIFGKPKVHKLNVAFGVQHEILRFQISVHDPSCMKVFESLKDTSDDKLGGMVIKIAFI